MKTILIATDFSPAARNAAEYGISLAKAFGSKVILFSAYYERPAPATEVPIVITPDNMKKHIHKQLVKEEMAINTGSKVTVELVCGEGAAADTILKAANENDAGLIVAGMKKEGRVVRRVMGSTVTALASKSGIPLVIVPEDVRYSNITSIALANESDLEPDTDGHLLDLLQEIAGRFHSKIYLVRVARNRVKAAYESAHRPINLIRMIQALDPSYGSIEGSSVPEALNHFIEGHQVKMVALLPHMHSLFGKLFVRSTTRAMIFAANVPLLIVPGFLPEKESAGQLHEEAKH